MAFKLFESAEPFWRAERTCGGQAGAILMETSEAITQAAMDLDLLPAGDSPGVPGPRHAGLRIHAQRGPWGGTRFARWMDGRIVRAFCFFQYFLPLLNDDSS